MKKGSERIKTRIETENLLNLVQLNAFLSSSSGEYAYFFSTRIHTDPVRRVLFFPRSHNFLEKTLLVHYCYIIEQEKKDLLEAKYIEYNAEEGKINFTKRRGFQSPRLQYLPVFEVEKMSDKLSLQKDSEEVPIKEKIQRPMVEYQEGESLADVIRIARDLERLVLIVEKKQATLYLTGFFSSIFPKGPEEKTVGPVLYVKEVSQQKENATKNPFARYSKKEGVQFLSRKNSKKELVPLIHLESFPFNTP